MADVSSPRIGVFVVAYNAASTLASVLDRIPEDYRDSIDHVMVADDASTDSTFLIGVGYRETFGHLSITVVRHDENRGY
ncbi:MAG TPA: glycosyltransferase/methyltransferase, partial [Acidimicrobiaceae bacterium]|nr:glycosyltransferase/methyltransferase [Acidimicrobiaceae bacterium]